MTTGQPHPAAENPILNLTETMNIVFSSSITNSRFAILAESKPLVKTVVVWDWRAGKVLLASDPPASVIVCHLTRICISA